MDYTTLISFLAGAIALTLMPGPDNMYVLVQSLSNGAKSGVILSLGLASGIIIHTSLVAFGVSAFITQNEYTFLFVKIAGAIYMCYLAWMELKAEASIHLETNTNQKTLPQLYRQGFLMNVLNPKVTLFFLAFLPQFLFHQSMSSFMQLLILGILFMLQAAIIFSILAVSSGKLAPVLQQNKRFPIVMKWVKIVVLIIIAIMIFIP
ncbi:LysE family translocator [Prolixibacteraceae bacterium JC049]|nr:LysE family translocator [Prolixibacteraceae bacterium JC049]